MFPRQLACFSEYKSDPYSKGDPCKSICCRGDLRARKASPSGCYDTKVPSPRLPQVAAAWPCSLICSPSNRSPTSSWLGSSEQKRSTGPRHRTDSRRSPGTDLAASATRACRSPTTSASSPCSRFSSSLKLPKLSSAQLIKCGACLFFFFLFLLVGFSNNVPNHLLFSCLRVREVMFSSVPQHDGTLRATL